MSTSRIYGEKPILWFFNSPTLKQKWLLTFVDVQIEDHDQEENFKT